MRPIFTFLLLLLFSVQLSAQAYFCMEEGRQMIYVRRNVKGDIKWVHELSVLQISDSSSSLRKISYTSVLKNDKGRSKMKRPAEMSALVSSKGNVRMDISSSLAAVLESFLWKNAEVTAEGGETVLPAELVPGDSLPPAFGKVHALGMTMDVSVTDRKVLRTETLDTPAGRFECVVVRERKLEKGMMRNRETTGYTWYARGIGMVRHDTYDRKGRLDTSEVLERICNIQKSDTLYK